MFKVQKLCPLEVLGVDFVLNMVYKAGLKQTQTKEVDQFKLKPLGKQLRLHFVLSSCFFLCISFFEYKQLLIKVICLKPLCCFQAKVLELSLVIYQKLR